MHPGPRDTVIPASIMGVCGGPFCSNVGNSPSWCCLTTYRLRNQASPCRGKPKLGVSLVEPFYQTLIHSLIGQSFSIFEPDLPCSLPRYNSTCKTLRRMTFCTFSALLGSRPSQAVSVFVHYSSTLFVTTPATLCTFKTITRFVRGSH